MLRWKNRLIDQKLEVGVQNRVSSWSEAKEELSSSGSKDSPRSESKESVEDLEARRAFEKARYKEVCQKIKRVVDDFLFPYITRKIRSRDYLEERVLEEIVAESLSEEEKALVQRNNRSYADIAARRFIRKGIQGFYQNYEIGVEVNKTEGKPKLIHYILTKEDNDYCNYLQRIVFETLELEFFSLGWTPKQLMQNWDVCFYQEQIARMREAKECAYHPVTFLNFSGDRIEPCSV